MLDAEQHREIPSGDRSHRGLHDRPHAPVRAPANESDESCDHTEDNTCERDRYTRASGAHTLLTRAGPLAAQRDGVYGPVNSYPRLAPSSISGNPERTPEAALAALSDTPTAAGYGVVDEIARRSWLTGATVLAVRGEEVPEGASDAAILRYRI
ncbi:MAG: hypothetical protein ACHQCG_01780 [Solirubrobacterales bacterium]